jgi:hypothetical protein
MMWRCPCSTGGGPVVPRVVFSCRERQRELSLAGGPPAGLGQDRDVVVPVSEAGGAGAATVAAARRALASAGVAGRAGA